MEWLDIALKRAVATALSNAVMDIDNAREFSKLGGVSLLQDFLETKDEELEQIAISTIANIASSGKYTKQEREYKKGE